MMAQGPARPADTISLCMIVRDETLNLAACLASARPWVDEIVVVDTGSTDGTPELAESLGAQVSTFVWGDDFAAARNAALARTTGAWVLWLDADERLDPAGGPRLRQLVQQPGGGRPRCYRVLVRHWRDEARAESEMVSHYSGRLFQRHPQIRWEGPIHERIVHVGEPGGMDVVCADEVVIDHVGHTTEARQAGGKDARNVRMLQAAIARYPQDGFYQAKLGAHYLEAGDHATAITHLTAALDRSHHQARAGYRASAYGSLAAAHLARGDTDKAVAVSEEGLATFTDYPPLWWQSGVARLLAADWDAAADCFQHARACGLAEGSISRRYALDRSAITWRPLLGLAAIHELRSEWAEALAVLQTAASEAPQQQEVVLALTRVACASMDWATATDALGRLPDDAAALDPEIGRLQAQVSSGQGQTQQAYDQLDRTLRAHPSALAVRLDLAHLLRESGEASEALAVLSQALDQPELPAPFYRCLAAVLTDLGRHDDAAAAGTLAQHAPALAPVGASTPALGRE